MECGKNPPPVDYSQFSGHKRESIASSNSVMSNGSFKNENRRDSLTNQTVYAGRYADYVHDVPIDLFTISKMSMSTHNSISRQNTGEENHDQ